MVNPISRLSERLKTVLTKSTQNTDALEIKAASTEMPNVKRFKRKLAHLMGRRFHVNIQKFQTHGIASYPSEMEHFRFRPFKYRSMELVVKDILWRRA